MNTKQLYKISKYCYNESFLTYTLNMAGSNFEDIQKKMKKNPKYIKRQTLGMRFVFLFYLGSLVLLPYRLFTTLDQYSRSAFISDDWLLFCSNLVIGIMLVIQWIFLLMLGLFQGSTILQGDQFRWLTTLPIKEKELQKISLFTFFRSIDTSVIGLVLTLPVGILFATWDPVLTIVGLIISLLNSFFGYSILIILSQKMSNVLNSNQANNRRNKIIRVAWLSSYVIIIMVIAIGMQAAYTAILSFIQYPKLDDSTLQTYNMIFSFIFMGPSQGTLLGSLFLGNITFFPHFLISIGSLVIFGLIGWRLTLIALKKLSSVIHPEQSGTSLGEEVHTLNLVSVEIKTPYHAFFEKDRNMATRDMQFLMFLIMAFLFPSASLLFPIIGGAQYADRVVVYSVVVIYQFMGSAFLTIGSMGIEQSGATIVASLPIIERQQAKAKLKWSFTILPLSIVIPLIYYAIVGGFLEAFVVFSITVSIGMITSVGILELMSLMFGKKKYKYVLEEYNSNKKILKYIVIFIIIFILYLFTFIPMTIFVEQGRLEMIPIIFLPIEVVISAILFVIFNNMFPKPKES